MTPRGLGVVAVLAVAPTPVAAQFTAALDIGAGTTHSDDAFSGPVAMLAPSFNLETGALRLGASGAYSNGPAGRSRPASIIAGIRAFSALARWSTRARSARC